MENKEKRTTVDLIIDLRRWIAKYPWLVKTIFIIWIIINAINVVVMLTGMYHSSGGDFDPNYPYHSG